jgi:hypothetical protein
MDTGGPSTFWTVTDAVAGATAMRTSTPDVPRTVTMTNPKRRVTGNILPRVSSLRMIPKIALGAVDVAPRET